MGGGCYKRIKRLIIPYLLWPVIYFICYFFIDRIFHLNYSSNLSALLWQLALGSSINPPLWFLAVLILLTVFFFSIFKLFNAVIAKRMLIFILIVSVYFQYSEVNKMFWNLRFEVRYTLGRVCEMFPYAITGYFLILDNDDNNKNRWFLLGSSFLGLLFIFRYTLFIAPEYGYGYEGICLFTKTVLFVIVAWYLPFDRLPILIKNAIIKISKYSMGVFCMHLGIGRILISILEMYDYKFNSFLICIIIFGITVLFSWMITKIPIKNIHFLVV